MAPRRGFTRVLIGAIVAAVAVLLGGIWLGGHPGDLPSPLRSHFFDNRPSESVLVQALGVLSTRYYRPIDRSRVIDDALAGMVAGLDDRYSRYIEPSAQRATADDSGAEAPAEIPVVTSTILTVRDVHIGYVRLRTFSDGSGDEVRAEVENVMHAHARALILDLRENGGGLISQAIDITSLFLHHGTIMSAVERGQPRRVYSAHGDAIAPRIPMAVLVDRGTASAAEIVAAALQEHGRATIVGTRTYGKGVFQLTLPLSNDGALDITIGQFFTPNGHNLGGGGDPAEAGIAPNVIAGGEPGAPADEALTAAERTVAAEVDRARAPARG